LALKYAGFGYSSKQLNVNAKEVTLSLQYTCEIFNISSIGPDEEAFDLFSEILAPCAESCCNSPDGIIGFLFPAFWYEFNIPYCSWVAVDKQKHKPLFSVKFSLVRKC
jgi:hypothetical protein